MNTVWLKVGLFLLGKLSGPAQEYMVAGFDWSADQAKKTGTKLDDWIVAGLRAVFTGGWYVSSGTGKMEVVIAAAINKLSPSIRYGFYQLLRMGQIGAHNNTIEGDEVAMDFLMEVVFPNGEPDKPEWLEGSDAPRTLGTRIL